MRIGLGWVELRAEIRSLHTKNVISIRGIATCVPKPIYNNKRWAKFH